MRVYMQLHVMAAMQDALAAASDYLFTPRLRSAHIYEESTLHTVGIERRKNEPQTVVVDSGDFVKDTMGLDVNSQ